MTGALSPCSADLCLATDPSPWLDSWWNQRARLECVVSHLLFCSVFRGPAAWSFPWQPGGSGWPTSFINHTAGGNLPQRLRATLWGALNWEVSRRNWGDCCYMLTPKGWHKWKKFYFSRKLNGLKVDYGDSLILLLPWLFPLFLDWWIVS